MQKIACEDFDPDGQRRAHVAAVVFAPDGPDRAIFFINADNGYFALLRDLVADKPEEAGFLLHQALHIGLEYLWRRDSGCECLCTEEAQDAQIDLSKFDA